MQGFNRVEFKQKVLGTGELLETYLKTTLLCSVEDSPSYHNWLLALFDQLQVLLKDTTLSPTRKMKLTDFICYVLLIGQPPIIRMLEDKVYPLVRNYAQYDRNLKLSIRGEEYFHHHPQYTNGNENKRAKIRRLGVQYIHFFLESVPVWASWVPQDIEDDKSISMFQKNYQILKQGGLDFPSQKDYIVYNEQNVEKKYGFIQVIMEDFFRESASGVTEKTQKSNIEHIGAIQNSNRSMSKVVINNGNEGAVPDTQIKVHNQGLPARQEAGNAFFNGKSALLAPPQILPFDQVQVQTASYQQNSPIKPIFLESISPINTVPIPPNYPSYSPLTQTFNGNQNLSEHIQFPQSPRYVPTFPAPSTQSIANPPYPQFSHSPNLSPIHSSRSSSNITGVAQQISDYNPQLPNDQLQSEMIPVSEFDEKVKMIQNKHLEEVSHLKMNIKELQTQVNYLRVQNIKLTQKLKDCQTKVKLNAQINYPPRQFNTEQILRLRSENAELKANILGECNEVFQFTNKTLQHGSANNSRFNKESREATTTQLFDPYYSRLSSEQQTRFKRTILKSKEILYKDKNVELGCLSSLLDINTVKIVLVLTNKGEHDINNFRINISQNYGVSVLCKSHPIRSLAMYSQEKETYQLRVDDWMFEPFVFQLNYQINKGEELSKQLILPLSRYKFMVSSNIPPLKCLIQRTIILNKSVVLSIQKLQEYSSQVFYPVGSGLEGGVNCLGCAYKIRMQDLGDSVKIGIEYQRVNHSYAQVLMQEITFLLSK